MSLLDTSPLGERPGLAERVGALRDGGPGWVVGVVTCALVALIPAVILVALVYTGHTGDLGGLVLLVLLIVAGTAALVDCLRQAGESVRLRRFAGANGVQVLRDASPSGYAGYWFGRMPLTIGNGFRTTRGPLLEVGTLRVVGQQQRSSTGPAYGFIRVGLTAPLPHIVLRSPRHPFEEVPAQPGTVRVPFGEVVPDPRTAAYTLTAPPGYAEDLAAVLTGDLRDLLLEATDEVVLEVAGDQAFVYSGRGFRLTEPQHVDRYVRIGRLLAHRLDQRIARRVSAGSDLPAQAQEWPAAAPPPSRGSRWARLALAVLLAAVAVPTVVVAVQHADDSTAWRHVLVAGTAALIAGAVRLVAEVLARRRA